MKREEKSGRIPKKIKKKSRKIPKKIKKEFRNSGKINPMKLKKKIQ